MRIDNNKCITCGACLAVCQHNARSYSDDTERFFRDLKAGIKISVIVAPAFRSNFIDGQSILAWLRSLGVSTIVDVSLGADICTWAHIRYIERNNPASIITQPCPAIVSYIEKYHSDLIKNLSPVHSPMLCTAIYLKKYMHLTEGIAAISPCAAKSNEFVETGLIGYNVTFKNLLKYIENNHIHINNAEFRFNNVDSSLGKIYSMPGGLKENVEFYLGKSVRVDKSEGQDMVYRHIDEYAEETTENLPAIFDVLNCPDGCNSGTGCVHENSVFQINRVMDEQRRNAMEEYPLLEKEKCTELFMLFDENFDISDFIRKYKKYSLEPIPYTDFSVEAAFESLGKTTEEQREHNCYACGSKTCLEMAVRIAKDTNIPENCMEKNRLSIMKEHKAFISQQNKNYENLSCISDEVADIRKQFDDMQRDLKNVENAMEQYNIMARLVSDMSFQTQLLSFNAAVEAGRAGKAGIGFAVIAEAIRELATNSQKSVSDVADTNAFAKKTIRAISEASENVDQSIIKVSDYIEVITDAMKSVQGDNSL